MVALINPATGKPFREVAPSQEITRLRREIMRLLASRGMGPRNSRSSRFLTGKYDAAQTTSQNELHWKQADLLSPNAANTLSVRKVLRSRSRYETANNGYLKGILLSLANDFVGSGPTLQVTDVRFSDAQREAIEKVWVRHAKKIKLRRKLWRMRFAKGQDGETFAFAFTDRNLPISVKLNYRVVECDQISRYEIITGTTTNEVDGIRFDRTTGEPIQYHLLNEHPGEIFITSLRPLDGKWYPASQVIHWFRQLRGELRGIPETITTLPLWALLRRYTLAVVQNAEIAADFTVLLKSLQSPNTTAFLSSGSPLEPTDEDPNDWFDSFPIDRGLMTVLPSGYEMEQLDPRQPVTVYDSFVNALVQEAARSLLCPRNMALGNSGGYNMASGTLDRQMYRQAINEERNDCNDEVLDKEFGQWWFEAIRSPGYFEDEVAPVSITQTVLEFSSLRNDVPDHLFRWDEVPEHTDPVKVAQAIDILHKGRHLSDVDIQEGRFNRRVEDHYRNLEKQDEWRKKNDPQPVTASSSQEISTKVDDPDDDSERTIRQND